MSRILKSLGSLTDRIICVICAIVLSQAPVYMAQYEDVLSGAHQEAAITYGELENRALQYHLSIDEFLSQLEENDDQMVRDNAEVSRNAVDRFLNYQTALQALQKSNLFTRPFVLIRHFDRNIHHAIQFEPNIPLTLEGFAYGIIGIAIGMLISGLLGSLFNRIFGTRKKTKTPV